jgi:mono/diheme cytochrome c family protein
MAEMLKRWITVALIAAIATSLAPILFEMRAPAIAATSSAAAGQKVYNANCSACHNANGSGQSGVFPPLAGNPMVTGSPDKVIAAVKNGLTGQTTVNGKSYNGSMPAWKSKLSDAEIADVITYIRSSWGNKADAVTEAQVAGLK